MTVLIAAMAEAAQEVAIKPLYKAPKYDDQERKVRGDHPQRRLQSVNKFMCRWLVDVIGGNKAARTCNRITDMVYKHEETFVTRECSYYNPEVKNGGPNPDPDMEGMRPATNPNAKKDFVPRRERREDNEGEVDLEITAEDEEAYDDCDGTETGELKEFCESSADKRTTHPTERKLKRYTTLLMKWCDRYIGECYGQRVNNLCFNRAKKLHKNLLAAIPQ